MSLEMQVRCDVVNNLSDFYFTPLTNTVDPGTFNTVEPGKRFHIRVHPADTGLLQLGETYVLVIRPSQTVQQEAQMLDAGTQ